MSPTASDRAAVKQIRSSLLSALLDSSGGTIETYPLVPVWDVMVWRFFFSFQEFFLRLEGSRGCCGKRMVLTL